MVRRLPLGSGMKAHVWPVLKIAGILGVALVVASLTPGTAEAQARGTLQATATVVDTRTSANALQAARGAITQAVADRPTASTTVTTVAQVSVSRPIDRPAMVVTIDYSRN